MAHFSAYARKIKKIYHEKVSYIPEKWNFLALILKNFLHFLIFQKTESPQKFLIVSRKKAFLIFPETETSKKFLHFKKGNFLIFQETETLKSFLYSGSNFLCSKNEKNPLLKCFLCFRKWNFLASRLKSF